MSKFLNLIKIRVGEPITAIDINKNGICFGSISGYVGYYQFSSGKIEYINELFDELIRDINLNIDNNAYISVGDLHGLKVNFSDITNITHNIISLGKKSHSANTCPGNIIFMKNNVVLQVTATPTQNKEIDYKYKNGQNTYMIDLTNEEAVELGNIPLSQFSVPQDFNHKKLLWTQFSQILSLHIFCCKQQKPIYRYKFDQNVKFVSFCKLAIDYVYFVMNQKQVCSLNLKTNEIQVLYEHKSPICAFNMFTQKIKQQNQEDVESQKMIKKQLKIISVDYDCNVKQYYDTKIQKEFNILKLQGLDAKIQENKYIFDMDYPYYLKFNNHKLVITSDYGILVIEL